MAEKALCKIDVALAWGFQETRIQRAEGFVMSTLGPAAGRRLFRVLGPAGATGNQSGANVKKIYVGNLPFSATEEEVSQLFGQYGQVHSVALITDRESGRPRGFGFVEMDDSEALEAISALDGHEMGGRNLRVNEAQDRPRRGGPGGGGGRGGRGGGGGGGRGGRGGGRGGYGDGRGW
jgi:cold-inducible RNA-binding protein